MPSTKIIEGANMVMGRLSSLVAGELLKGNTIHIVNAEKVLITGNRKDIVGEFKNRMDLTVKGNPFKAPKNSRLPHFIVRECIEGMLPRKTIRGREAMKRLKVHIGIPAEFTGKKIEILEDAKPLSERKAMTVVELSKDLGMAV